MKLSTSQRIEPTQWNKVTHRVRKGAKTSKTINAYLDKLEGMVKETYLRLITEYGKISPDRLKDEIQKQLKTGKNKETFIQFCERYSVEGKGGVYTKKIYKTTLMHLKRFPGNKDFEDVDLNWLNRYTKYLESKGLAANTVGKNITYIKLFLNEAAEQGVNRFYAYKTPRYKKPGEESENIYLTENELLYMYGLDPLPKYQDRARDRFIIGAFTALRFSDFSMIKQENIENSMIYFMTQKTRQRVVIPLHWVVRDIFKKYKDNGGLPPPISNQKMNKYIKLVAAGAGIEEPVIKHRTEGGVRTQKTFQKWELVSTHTARRSAATNMYLAGIPPISIMKITGHKTERSFMKYIKISQLENAIHIAGNPFFQTPWT